MTPYRAAIPFLVVGVSVGVLLIEFMKTDQNWLEAFTRLACVWAGISTFGIPLLLERWEEQRLSRQQSRRKRRRRSSSQAESASE